MESTIEYSEFNLDLMDLRHCKLVTITMNIMWIVLLLVFMVWSNKRMKNKGINKVLILLTDDQPTVKSRPVLAKSYTSCQLHAINHSIKLENRRNIPNFDTIRRVKELKINQRRIRLSKYQKVLSRKANLNNLNEIEMDPERSDLSCKHINIGTVNARSVRSKSELIFEMMIKESLDLLLITESWLKKKEQDIIWLKSPKKLQKIRSVQ